MRSIATRLRKKGAARYTVMFSAHVFRLVFFERVVEAGIQTQEEF